MVQHGVDQNKTQRPCGNPVNIWYNMSISAITRISYWFILIKSIGNPWRPQLWSIFGYPMSHRIRSQVVGRPLSAKGARVDTRGLGHLGISWGQRLEGFHISNANALNVLQFSYFSSQFSGFGGCYDCYDHRWGWRTPVLKTARPQHSKRFCLTGTGSTRAEGGFQRSNRQGGRKSRGISEFLVTKLTENLQVGRVYISTLGDLICFHIFFLYHGPIFSQSWISESRKLWVNLGLVAENRAYLHLALHGFKTFHDISMQQTRPGIAVPQTECASWRRRRRQMKFSSHCSEVFIFAEFNILNVRFKLV